MASENGNAAAHFVDRHGNGPARTRPAFVEGWDGGRSLTYADLMAQSDKLAGLCAQNGLRPEDRAVMLVLDQIEFPVIFWGCLKAGVIPVPINTRLPGPIYDQVLADCAPRALFVSEEMWDLVGPRLDDHPSIDKVFVVGQRDFGRISFAQALKQAPSMHCLPASPDACAFWLYSSGSTGRPKGVKHVHGSLRVTAETYGRQVLGIRPDDVVFSVAKLFFAYGLGNAMTFPMSVGAQTVLFRDRPTPEATLAVIARHQPTIFCGVPTLYAAMLAHMDATGTPPGTGLRACISAGEALPADVGRRWADAWGTDILDGVGSTEMLHIFLSNGPSDVVYGTSGTAVPGYDLRLVDETGAEIGPDTIGELLVNGDSAAEGYWNQRAKSRATFEGVWTRTGDKYTRTKEGRYVYCGRTDDMFKVSGQWVSPFEVEQSLAAHPAVLEAAVVAGTDSDGLQKPKAFVILSGEVSVDHLQAHTREQIGALKTPRWIDVVDDLPKTATGKIQRFKLREGSEIG